MMAHHKGYQAPEASSHSSPAGHKSMSSLKALTEAKQKTPVQPQCMLGSGQEIHL